MDALLNTLLDRAFEQVPALEANAAMARLRDSRGDDANLALSYEAVVPQQGGMEYLATRFLPRLVYFLDCRGAKLPHVHGVFVSLFHGDRLYFLEVADVIEVLVQATGLTPEQMAERYGQDSGGGGAE